MNIDYFVKKELTIAYNEFFSKLNILEPVIILEDKILPYLIIKNFPIPKNIVISELEYIYPIREEDILFVLNNYPEQPPIGFYINKNSPNIEIYQKIFDKNIFFQNKNITSNENYIWIDFRYPNKQWNYNLDNIKKGDNLTKFFVLLYAKLSGENRVPFIQYIEI